MVVEFNLDFQSKKYSDKEISCDFILKIKKFVQYIFLLLLKLNFLKTFFVIFVCVC
jgi:hypothetical protein